MRSWIMLAVGSAVLVANSAYSQSVATEVHTSTDYKAGVYIFTDYNVSSVERCCPGNPVYLRRSGATFAGVCVLILLGASARGSCAWRATPDRRRPPSSWSTT